MKSGIVMEIIGSYAIIMTQNGTYKKVKVEPEWELGDVVFIKGKQRNGIHQWIGAIIACVFISILTIIGYHSYYYGETVVSIDINPSMELTINHWNRVIDAVSYNQEGEAILNNVKINHKNLDEAIFLLFSNGLEEYVTEEANILLTVQTSSKKGTLGIKENLKDILKSCMNENLKSSSIEIYSTDKEMLQIAHSYRMTAGKYRVIMQLKDVEPDIDISAYGLYTIDSIREKIEEWKASTNEEKEDDEKEGEQEEEKQFRNRKGSHGECKQ